MYGETFKDMKARPNFSDKYVDYQKGIHNGKQRYIKIDEHRKEQSMLKDILSRNTAVLDWYNSI